MQVSMTVNGEQATEEIEPRMLLVHFLRDRLGLTGTHWGCDTSNCGVCVVWVDQQPIKSCTMLAAMAHGREVSTVEGLEKDGELDPVQQGFMACHGLQCGFCTPGMMMTGRWLLDANPDPTEGEIREAISGQICRCTGYSSIVRSIRWAAMHPHGAADVQDDASAKLDVPDAAQEPADEKTPYDRGAEPGGEPDNTGQPTERTLSDAGGS